MIDQNLIRWVNASINKYFDDNKGSYALFIEGQNIDPLENQAYCELHISVGPDITENTATDSTIDVTVTLMCTVFPSDDNYAVHRMAGYFANLASGAIPIKKLGNDNTVDDQSLISCMKAVGKCRIQQWGYVTVEIRATPIPVLQNHVEMQYELNF